MPVVFEEILAEIEPELAPPQAAPQGEQRKSADAKPHELRDTLARIAYRTSRLRAD